VIRPSSGTWNGREKTRGGERGVANAFGVNPRTLLPSSPLPPPGQAAALRSGRSTAVIPQEVHERILCVATGDFRQVLTGCRPQEAAGITADLVDWSAGVVKLVEQVPPTA
jgi:hypothetical protein